MPVRTRMRKVVGNGSKCCGCRICQNICSLINEGECNPSKARLDVSFDQFTAAASIEVGPHCTLCGECIRWCPTQALSAAYQK